MPLFPRHSTPTPSTMLINPLDITPRVYTATANIAFVGGAAAVLSQRQARHSGPDGGLVSTIDIATGLLAVGGIFRMISADSRPFGVKSIMDITRRPPVPALRREENSSEPERADEKGSVVYANHVTRRGRIYRVTPNIPGMEGGPDVSDAQEEMVASNVGQPNEGPIGQRLLFCDLKFLLTPLTVQDGSDSTPPADSPGNDPEVVAGN